MAKQGFTRFVKVVKDKAAQMVTPPPEQIPIERVKEKFTPQNIVPVPLIGTTEYVPPEQLKEKPTVESFKDEPFVQAFGKIGRRLGLLKGDHVLTRIGDSIIIDIKSKTIPQQIVLTLREPYNKRLVINLPKTKK